MNTPIIVGIIAISALEIFLLLRNRNRKQRILDPNSPEGLAAKDLLNKLSAEARQFISEEVSSGRSLNGIKRLRKEVPGTALYQARNAVELLKHDIHRA